MVPKTEKFQYLNKLFNKCYLTRLASINITHLCAIEHIINSPIKIIELGKCQSKSICRPIMVNIPIYSYGGIYQLNCNVCVCDGYPDEMISIISSAYFNSKIYSYYFCLSYRVEM